MEIKKYLEKQAEYINRKIREYIPEGIPEKLFDAMAYSLTAGGKRLRPVLILESARAVGFEEIENIVDIAVASEFIHTYSLIHDDLPAMDDDELRRGKPTCHIVYGEAIAILAGDGLQSYAFELISSNKKVPPLVRVINLLAHGTGIYGMVGGQAADILHEKENAFDDIQFIHTHKTAKFIQSCCQIGGVLGNGAQEEIDAMLWVDTVFTRVLPSRFRMISLMRLGMRKNWVKRPKRTGKRTNSLTPPFMDWKSPDR